MVKSGKSDDMIASVCHVSKREISEVKKVLETDTTLPLPKPRGRPSVIAPDIISQSCNMTTEDPDLGSGKRARIIEEDLDMKILQQTVCSFRRQLRFPWTKARNHPMITTIQERKRLDFCRRA
jgi:transposase